LPFLSFLLSFQLMARATPLRQFPSMCPSPFDPRAW
jgi:hypothetical protein